MIKIKIYTKWFSSYVAFTDNMGLSYSPHFRCAVKMPQVKVQ